ncbi:unnamed protein product [Strongylus vulgaris]|uniref:Uncharacterized protein n=1 Tax=Strongylus vulgaris TaxID=40348 RepID=A0A3P7LC44_STRVU|nr:unnamed protein product [Strongylus vulgaris]
MWPLVVLCLLFNPINAQFAEIASIATSLLGSGLGPALGGAAAAGSAAAPGLGALSQIGQLYQLAQGALQLTGTGVGVLNQASEGNWFPAVLEQASKNTTCSASMNDSPMSINLQLFFPPYATRYGLAISSLIAPLFTTTMPIQIM